MSGENLRNVFDEVFAHLGGIPRPVLYFPAVGYPPDAGHGGRRPGSAAYLPPSGTPFDCQVRHLYACFAAANPCLASVMTIVRAGFPATMR